MSATQSDSLNNLVIRGGTESCLTPLADVENWGTERARLVHSQAGISRAAGTRTQAPQLRAQGSFSASDVIRGETGTIAAQRGAFGGQGRGVCSPAGSRRRWLSCCNHGSRRGPECCCYTRPGACPGPGSQLGFLCPRAGRSALAASSACRQAQHRPKLVMWSGGCPGTRLGKQGDRGAFMSRWPGEAQPLRGPECCVWSLAGWDPHPAQVWIWWITQHPEPRFLYL